MATDLLQFFHLVMRYLIKNGEFSSATPFSQSSCKQLFCKEEPGTQTVPSQHTMSLG